MKRWLFTVLIILFSLIFLVSGYFLLDYYLASRKNKNTFDELSQIMNQAMPPVTEPVSGPSQQPDDPNAPSPETEPTAPALVEVTNPDTGETLMVLPEFAELYNLNNHIVGWIKIGDTDINYPVMQTPNMTDYYLYRGYDRQYSRHGCIYVREECDVFTPSDNITIYGHRMGDGTMFNDLHDYADPDFYEENRYITFNTLTERHTYEIFSIFRVSSTVGHPFQYHMFVDAADEEEFNEFIANCHAYSSYDTGVTASYGDKLITLSTCEYTQVNGRLVVVAKRID